MIYGPSGSGKSTSLRNMPPDKTLIINTERKALPFKNKNGIEIYEPSGLEDFNNKYLEALEDINKPYVIIDSFTSLWENILIYCQNKYQNYDIWSNFQRLVFENILLKSKESSNLIVFIAHDMASESEMGVFRLDVKIQGKALSGAILKEFTLGLYSHVRANPNGEGMQYGFITNSDGLRLAKTPIEMFEDAFIPNDMAEVIKVIEAYYGA